VQVLIKTADGESSGQPNTNQSLDPQQRCDKKAQQGACVIFGERVKCQRKLSNNHKWWAEGRQRKGFHKKLLIFCLLHVTIVFFFLVDSRVTTTWEISVEFGNFVGTAKYELVTVGTGHISVEESVRRANGAGN